VEVKIEKLLTPAVPRDEIEVWHSDRCTSGTKCWDLVGSARANGVTVKSNIYNITKVCSKAMSLNILYGNCYAFFNKTKTSNFLEIYWSSLCTFFSPHNHFEALMISPYSKLFHKVRYDSIVHFGNETIT